LCADTAHRNTLSASEASAADECVTLNKDDGATFRIDGAKRTTAKVASVTTGVASRVGGAIGSVAFGAKETAKKAGFGKEGSVTHGVASTMKDSVCALVEVFDAMHDAGRHVVSTGAEETATCVQYRCAFAPNSELHVEY
jgi:hypothetical protein